jgi:subtilase family serine protease
MLVVCGLAAPAVATSATTPTLAHAWLNGRGHYMHRGAHGEADVNVCSDAVSVGFAHCNAHVRTDVFGKGVRPMGAASPNANPGTGAYGPSYLQSAYNAPSATNGAGQVVAIVDAFGAPTVEADLAAYRSSFGLPACTTANGCFTAVNQSGGTTYPAPPTGQNAGWALETALDVQMVSAICPLCHIVLVEANNSSLTNLGIGVNTAVALGANVVSNSYGSNEFSTESQADHYYDHPGVAIVASSGDSGYGVEYPAASPNVVAVGGTSLHQSTNTGTRNATETVWSGAGSGCSAYEPKPAWQTDTGCARRTVADVSAVADPYTGVWVYAAGQWEIVGGTSVAAPIVGSLYALAGNGSSSVTMGSLPYSTPSAFNDVVSGSNGTCVTAYLCNGTAGYDGPTGLGTPNAVAGFTLGGSSMTPPSPPLPTPDFSVTASSLTSSMRPGETAESTVTVTPANGFTGSVALSASVSPSAGLSTSFSPPSIMIGAGAGSSTLTFAAHTGGKYVVTITAQQGALVHATTLTVTVNDFVMQVSPAKATVVRGKKVRYTLKLTPAGAFNAAVKLSISGLPARDTVIYVHNPAAATSSQSITITTSVKDARGALSLRFTGVSGVLSHSVTVVLSVQ